MISEELRKQYERDLEILLYNQKALESEIKQWKSEYREIDEKIRLLNKFLKR